MVHTAYVFLHKYKLLWLQLSTGQFMMPSRYRICICICSAVRSSSSVFVVIFLNIIHNVVLQLLIAILDYWFRRTRILPLFQNLLHQRVDWNIKLLTIPGNPTAAHLITKPATLVNLLWSNFLLTW